MEIQRFFMMGIVLTVFIFATLQFSNTFLDAYGVDDPELDKLDRYDKPIVTEILPFTSFYPAEDFHQDFYKHSSERYKRYEELSGRKDFKNKFRDVPWTSLSDAPKIKKVT